VGWIVGALEGAVVGGIGVLAGALSSIGTPKDSVIRYETAITSNKFLVIAHGTAKAKSVLDTASTEQADVHQGIRE
jgi:hypothetical protein